MRLQGGQKDTHTHISTQPFNAASGPLLAIAFER